jgi:hypothetical protein
LAAFQTAQCPAGRRLAVITSSGGLAELILDVAAEIGIKLPPLSPAQKAEIEAEIGFVTGDGNPLDAWGSGTFAANLPLALKEGLLDARASVPVTPDVTVAPWDRAPDLEGGSKPPGTTS